MRKERIAAMALIPMLLAASLSAGCIFGGRGNKPSDTASPTVSEVPTELPENTDVPNVTDIPMTTDAAVTDAPATEEVTPGAGGKVTAEPVTQAPGNHASMGSKDSPARNTMPLDLYGLSEAECEAWFSDAVFVGDSLTIGWKNYNNLMLQKNPDFFGVTRFLCEGSYGVGHALEPISDESLHPVYGGEQHFIWDSIKMMGAKKVFILFGLNDLSIWGVDGALSKYNEVIDKIAEVNPEAEIFVVSAMYMYKGSEREVLNNANLYKFNCGLNAICNRRGLEFVNIASHVIDEDGFVPDKYSSDKYVHQTYAAYEIWAQVLRSVAARHILGYERVIFD